MLIVSADYGCSDEMLTIVSMLSVQTVFLKTREQQEEAEAAREKFMVAESDHLSGSSCAEACLIVYRAAS